jgi:DNA-binding PadR family transcriptional regulator
LLGLPAEGPASGYDLAGRFHDVLGPGWPAQHSKIYAELGRLTADGVIEADSLGPRGRKAYRIIFLLAEPHTVVV